MAVRPINDTASRKADPCSFFWIDLLFAKGSSCLLVWLGQVSQGHQPIMRERAGVRVDARELRGRCMPRGASSLMVRACSSRDLSGVATSLLLRLPCGCACASFSPCTSPTRPTCCHRRQCWLFVIDTPYLCLRHIPSR